MVKKLFKKYFSNFTYFYRYLSYRIFILIGLTLLFGVMDGLGLSMFLPLFKIAADKAEKGSSNMDQTNKMVQFFETFHIDFNLFNMLLLMVFFFLLKGIFYYIKGLYDARVARYFIVSTREKAINKFSRIKFEFFVTSDVGRIQNLMTNQIGNLLNTFRTYLSVLQNAIMVLVYMGFAFAMNHEFAVLIIVGGLFFNVIFQRIYKISKQASRVLVKAGDDYQGMIIQLVTNFKYLKATGRVNEYSQKINNQIENIENVNYRLGKLGAITSAIREPILVAIVAGVILLQVYVMHGQLSTIIVSLLFFYRALASVTNLQGSYNSFIGNIGTMENVEIFEKELSDNEEVNGNISFSSLNNNITLDKVNFSYGKTKILKDLDLKIQKNETIAFVGESGSGKTTLVNVISGLLSPSPKSYKVDGNDINQMEKTSFQNKIGYISQDPVIFNDTIFNNVTLWAEKTPATLERFNWAIKKAQLNEMIDNLEEKGETRLGNNGINLSGGQKQRVSIARELYKDTEILILDEATSALDSETERYIQENIDKLQGQYTIIIVAHRLATIKNADRVVLMHKGEIVDIDTFEKLKDKSPRFKKMVELQEI